MKHLRPMQKPSRADGFTIVELMIATVIFSVVLLILTFGVIEMTHIYYKGITESKTQNSARNAINAISQTIEFSGGQVNPTADQQIDSSGNLTTVPLNAGTSTYAFCIGSTAFYYQLGYEVEVNPSASRHQAYHGLVVADNDSACPNPSLAGINFATSSTMPSGGQELLLPGMRLSRLQVIPSNNATGLYTVNVQVTYGDDVLLNNPTSENGFGGTANCIGAAGDEFCATANLQTAVEKRVN